jgi:hypothetical protein
MEVRAEDIEIIKTIQKLMETHPTLQSKRKLIARLIEMGSTDFDQQTCQVLEDMILIRHPRAKRKYQQRPAFAVETEFHFNQAA